MENIVNILLVDDDEVDCMNVQRAFKKSSIMNPLSIAHNGVEALEDLHNISVFVMTTSNDDRDRFEAYNYNVAGYIIKPISFENFVAAVSILNNFWQLCEQP